MRCLAILIIMFTAVGCTAAFQKEHPPSEHHVDGRGGGMEAPARTLFEWAVAGESREHGDANEAIEMENGLVTDRPDFTESSSTVGRDRVQLEMGYTYTRDNESKTRVRSHSFPEVLVRWGLFAEWLEFRIGQNYVNEHSKTSGIRDQADGFEDLYLGAKLALTPQRDYLPEMGLLVQTTLPTGADDHSAEEALPGVNWVYSWEVLPDSLSLAGSTQANKAMEYRDHSYLEIAQSVAMGYSLSDKIGAYTEWYAFFTSGARESGVGPEHYFNGGFTYLVTPDLQFDIRGGIGLNRRADDFFVGAGFAMRY